MANGSESSWLDSQLGQAFFHHLGLCIGVSDIMQEILSVLMQTCGILQEVYYLAPKTVGKSQKISKGKLVDKYRNTRKILKTSGVIKHTGNPHSSYIKEQPTRKVLGKFIYKLHFLIYNTFILISIMLLVKIKKLITHATRNRFY